MARPSSDLDPKGEDIIRKRRKRKDRAKPDPQPDLAAKKAAMRSRAVRRVHTPAVMFEPQGDGWRIEAPHGDEDLWRLQIADAFATRSASVMHAFTDQLEQLCSRAWDSDLQRWKPDETELSAILAMVADAQPKTILEAAQVAQAVAVHLVTMRLAKHALNNGGMVMEKEAALLGKLARTYTMQMDSLRASKGKSRSTRQSIKVTRETHYHQHLHDHTRGAAQNGGEPHAKDGGELRNETAEGIAGLPALPSPEQEDGTIVPLTRRAK